ncbi:MAG: F0F1 ATP synthase subunit A [Burkholderiaceae bacterium]
MTAAAATHAATDAAAHAPTPSEYIVHHLSHLNTSGHAQKTIVDFSIVNIDTVIYSVLLGALMCWLLRKAALAIRADQVPNRFVSAIESLVEFVHEQARSIVHGDVSKIAPLALATFIWIVFMNTMDLLPVDLLPRLGELVGIHYMRVVPTADLNATMAMSLTVLGASLYYGIKIKKPGGFVHELLVAPFGSSKNPIIFIIMAVINFVMQVIEYIAKTVSLGMRLFGNMYAGELLFMLIALLGGAFAWTTTGFLLGAGHVLAGTAWAIFHILIVLLQAFIFMMLTLVYLGQAHEAH